MTLQQLLYVLTVSKEGSMNQAAEKLYISQPTLTFAIRSLEKELHIQIFNRSSHGVTVTNEGREFLTYARQIYQQYELMEQEYLRPKKRVFGVSTQHYSFVTKAFVDTARQFDASRFEYAIRETRTVDVIHDVAQGRSAIGVLFRSRHNRMVLNKMLSENRLEFHPLIQCSAYVYLWKGHPLAKNASISMEELCAYPCLCFEQGDQSSSYFAEEILSEREYPQMIRATDRATMLNLMVGLNGFTLCCGIICQELNGTEYLAVPYKEDRDNQNSRMEIGYITQKNSQPDDITQVFVREMEKYLKDAQTGAAQ